MKNAVKKKPIVASQVTVKLKKGRGRRGASFTGKAPSGMAHVTKAPKKLTGKGGYYDPSS